MPTHIVKKFPPCDVCQSMGLPKPMDATADSPLKMQERTIWGYSCEHHAFLRTTPITYLYLEEDEE